MPTELKTATFGAGCFWGVEDDFIKRDGVVETAAGFMGGDVENPSYKQVSTGKTGHAEVVHIKYDPNKIKYEELLDMFWKMHDPTQINRQGLDVGTQYRSVVFYHDEEQKKLAEESKKQLAGSGKYEKAVVTEIVPASDFWKAEEYHQKYVQKGGVC